MCANGCASRASRPGTRRRECAASEIDTTGGVRSTSRSRRSAANVSIRVRGLQPAAVPTRRNAARTMRTSEPPHQALGACASRDRLSSLLGGPRSPDANVRGRAATRSRGRFTAGADQSAMPRHGAMVSMMILIPANALSISRSTRSTSDFRNSCSSSSSEVSPLSSLIELEVRRPTEDLIRSASFST